ncbi:MAG: NUDIX domain-containing protein [Acidimicrobiia bacterium]
MTRDREPPAYDPAAYPAVAVAVDIVVLTIRERELQVLLIERGEEPHLGSWALPGGFVRPDEALEAAAARELLEETGVDAADHIMQFGAYGDPVRDPRMRVVSIAFLAVVRRIGDIAAGSDARGAALVPVAEVLAPPRRGRRRRHLAFDHERILADGVDRAANMLETTSLATAFVGPRFTLAELREVYEATWRTPLDPGNFRRKVLSMDGFVEPTEERADPGAEGGKPATLYEAGGTEMLSAPIQPPRPRHR